MYIRCTSNASDHSLVVIRTCGRDILGKKVLDEFEGVRAQGVRDKQEDLADRADRADRANRAVVIATARSGHARHIGSGEHGFIGQVAVRQPARQPIDASLELVVGSVVAFVATAAHTNKVFVRHDKPDHTHKVKTDAGDQHTACCC